MSEILSVIHEGVWYAIGVICYVAILLIAIRIRGGLRK